MNAEVLKALLRHVLTAVGGAAAAASTNTCAGSDVASNVLSSVASGNPDTALGAAAAVAGLAWSIYDKRKK